MGCDANDSGPFLNRESPFDAFVQRSFRRVAARVSHRSGVLWKGQLRSPAWATLRHVYLRGCDASPPARIRQLAYWAISLLARLREPVPSFFSPAYCYLLVAGYYCSSLCRIDRFLYGF